LTTILFSDIKFPRWKNVGFLLSRVVGKRVHISHFESHLCFALVSAEIFNLSKEENMKRKRSGKQNWGAMALVMVLAVFLFAPNSAIGATIVIDDMSVTQGSSGAPAVTDSSPTPPGTDTDGITGAAANLIGGARLLEITHTAGPGGTTSGWVDTTTPHAWHVQNSDQATGWGRAVWCGSSTVTDIDTVYNLALDLTNLDYFNFVQMFADQISTFTFEVFTDATNGARATVNLTANETKNNLHLAKTDFTDIGAGVTWSNITRIELRVGPVLALDIRCLEIQAITSENPGLSCTKDFDKDYVESGDEVTATVVITNTGDVATYVKVVDVLDAGLTYKETVAGFTAPTTVGGQTLTWDSLPLTPAAELGPGASLTLKYVITVDTIAEGDVLCNDVTCEALNFPGTDTSCQACVRTAPKAPTFTQWGMIGFFLVLGAVAVCFMRRRSSVS